MYIDEEQLRWFKQALREAAGRPVVVFSHAPPQGCGLTVIPVRSPPGVPCTFSVRNRHKHGAVTALPLHILAAAATSWVSGGCLRDRAYSCAQSVHVKNRCAFLNHSSNAGEFMRLVEEHPNIALWFSVSTHHPPNPPAPLAPITCLLFSYLCYRSANIWYALHEKRPSCMEACRGALYMQGHFHLSHNYMRSISVAGNCAFVQTGVIGDCNRDGFRHSRVLKGAAQPPAQPLRPSHSLKAAARRTQSHATAGLRRSRGRAAAPVSSMQGPGCQCLQCAKVSMWRSR